MVAAKAWCHGNICQKRLSAVRIITVKRNGAEGTIAKNDTQKIKRTSELQVMRNQECFLNLGCFTMTRSLFLIIIMKIIKILYTILLNDS